MKIAIFYNLGFSGAKRTVFEHAKGLKSLGHMIDVYTIDEEHDIFDPGSIADNEYRYIYKPNIIPLPFLKRLTHDLSDFYVLKELHKKIASDIDSKEYDVVLVHTDKITQAPYITRFLKTAHVYFCLEPLKIAYEYGLRISDKLSLVNKLYESWNRHMRKRIDLENAIHAQDTLAISYFGQQLMIQSYDLYPKVSYLGVDTKLFQKKQIKKKNQILFIGQKIKMNGFDYAQEAIDLIPKNKRPSLKVLSIERSKTGRLSDEAVVELYNESLVTLCLSNNDTFGLVALESLACEVPVVAFNVAGYRETLIDNKTGYLVDFDPQSIADKITMLIDNPKKIQEMGEHGRKWVTESWTWEKQIKNLEKNLIHISTHKK